MGNEGLTSATEIGAITPYDDVVGEMVPKGGDCGDHDWYNSDSVTEECYHCRAGRRPYDPEHFTH